MSWCWRVIASVVCVAMVGCRHRTAQAPVIPTSAPVAVASVAGPKNPPQLAPETPPPAPLATVPVVPATAAPAAKKAKKPRPVAAAVRVEVAAAAPAPPPVAIGDLTAEEDASAGRKAVVNLINENERRLASLSAEVKERQKDQVLRVRNFQVDARKVLAGGDEDAAITLATKAKVLLDELTK